VHVVQDCGADKAEVDSVISRLHSADVPLPTVNAMGIIELAYESNMATNSTTEAAESAATGGREVFWNDGADGPDSARRRCVSAPGFRSFMLVHCTDELVMR
jgi:hypothetical protein